MEPPRKKVKRATQPLSITHPHLMTEWDYERNARLDYDPNVLTHGSNKKVYWVCQLAGHKWDSHIFSRTRGKGCPYCSGNKVCADNCLANNDVYNICREWDQAKNGSLTPNDVVPKTHNKVWWKCHNGHSWEARIKNRTNGHSCPYCVGQKVSEDNCLANNDPRGICQEWDYDKNDTLTPSDVTQSSRKKIWWKCKINSSHKWEARIDHRLQGTGCPDCYKNSRK